MSRVEVRLFAGAADAFGSPDAEVTGVENLAELVERLVSSNAEGADPARLREVLDQCSFFVDGEHDKSLDASLPDGCRVDVLPPFAGG